MNLRNLPSLPHWLIPFPKLRIRLTYLWGHGRLPNLRNPQLFTELVQRRKLVDRSPELPGLVNKVTAKAHVARLLGQDWTISTYWTGTILPTRPLWPYPFILKASHGCNQNLICRNAADWKIARGKAPKWLRVPYGLWLDEWAYRDVPRGFIVEPYLGSEEEPPVDYKIYVFGGRASFIQVHVNRRSSHRWVLYDRSWKQTSMFNEAPTTAPVNLEAMLASAEQIADHFDFARVDFYEIDGEPKFGEITFYPGSGLDRFDPPELDGQIGAFWLEAIDNVMLNTDRRPPTMKAA